MKVCSQGLFIFKKIIGHLYSRVLLQSLWNGMEERTILYW